MPVQTINHSEAGATGAAWGGVGTSLCIFVLIASDFLPVSLLTPIATVLRMSEGAAGQAISVSGIFVDLRKSGQTDRARANSPDGSI